MMAVGISRLEVRRPASLLLSVALAAVALLDGAAWAQSSVQPPGKPPVKLVPFPEDEEPASPGVQPAPAKAAPTTKSNFQPRFKNPGVQGAQYVEPITASGPREAQDGPQLQQIPMPADPHDSPGRPLVDEAFAKSKAATSESEYSEVIDLCRRGMKAGLKKSYDEYARRLLSWGYNRRGEARARAGHDKEALADFEVAIECNPTSWRAIHNRGVSQAAQGRVREALADFNRTIELNKKYGNAYFNRGELKYAQGDFAGATQDYTAALNANPGDPAILNSRGHALYRLEKFGEALRDYSEVLKSEPGFAAALINRGDTYCDLGQYHDAANDYRAAIDSNPKLGRAYQSAAWLMATCPDAHYRNDKLAIDVARKAIELDGDADYRYLETLAAAQANAGKFAEAKETQEKAIAKAPPSQKVTAEKRMALYQRDAAYRETPRVAFAKPEEDKEVRKASATSPFRRKERAKSGESQ